MRNSIAAELKFTPRNCDINKVSYQAPIKVSSWSDLEPYIAQVSRFDLATQWAQDVCCFLASLRSLRKRQVVLMRSKA